MLREVSDSIIALDIGTTKICAAIGEITDSGLNILAIHSCPALGLKKGVVVDIEAASNSIRKAISGIETHINTKIKDVIIGISGSHIKGFASRGAVGIKGKEVNKDDIDRVIDSARAVYIPLDREILHVLPTDFILDGQNGISDPIGMAGIRLEVEVYIVTAAAAHIQNLLKCCEKAEVNVEDMVLQSLACGEAVLTSDEREMGVALIDIGGGTTEIAVYKDGCLRKGVVLSVGGNHFTNDISIGLRVPFHEAERIKRRHSSVLPELSLKDMAITQTNPVGYKGRKLKTEGDLFDFDIEVEAMDEQVRRMPLKYVTEIIQPRAEELLQLIKNEMRVFYDGGLSISNIVLTGGTSLLSGFDRMATAMLSLPVRIGYPKIHDYPVFNLNEQSDIKLKKEFNNPVYSTAIGMLLLESNRHSGKNAAASGMIYGITKKIKNWFDNITQPYIRRKRA